MWKKKDYTGLNDLIWYSEAEYEELEDKLAKYENVLYNIYKAVDTCTPIDYIEDYIEEELLEKFSERREEEWNASNAERKAKE